VNWLLDTNVLSEPAKRTPSPEVMGWVGTQPVESLFTLSLAFAEIRAGIERVGDPVRRADLRHWLDTRVRPLFGPRVIETDEQFWIILLRVLARAKANNRTLPVTDLLFAVAAERHDLVVVTRNVQHFEGSGVRILNPWHADPVVQAV